MTQGVMEILLDDLARDDPEDYSKLAEEFRVTELYRQTVLQRQQRGWRNADAEGASRLTLAGLSLEELAKTMTFQQPATGCLFLSQLAKSSWARGHKKNHRMGKTHTVEKGE